MHFEETSSTIIVTTASASCGAGDPVVITYTSPPTLMPSPFPSLAPTFAFVHTDSNTKEKVKDSGFLLAVILPVIIVSTIAIVATISRVFFVKLP
jgi:hypothetical protein